MKRTTLFVLVCSALAAACGDDGGNNPGVDAGHPHPDGSGSATNHAPTVTDFAITTTEDTAVTQAVPATDPDGDPVTLSFGTPAHGTVTSASGQLTYTPAANYNGTDTFTVVASDGTLMAMANVNVTITAVNDAPVAVADTIATGGVEDTAFTFDDSMLLANDTDVDGDPLTVTDVSAPAHGTVTHDAGTHKVTFTPAANFNGSDASFTYTVSDGTLTATAVATLSFSAVNDAPVAVDDAAATDENAAKTLTSMDLTGNDTDVDLDTLTVTAVANPAHGTVNLTGTTITFTPANDFFGADAGFDYTVSDGTLTDTGHVTVTVNRVDKAPVAVDDINLTTAEDTALVLTQVQLTGNDTDADGDALTVTAVTGATHGTVALDAGTGAITYTPAANYNGPAQFSYTVSDGTKTDTGDAFITVTAVNDIPVAVADTTLKGVAGTTELFKLTVLTANDTDADGDTLTVTDVSGGSTGCVVALAAPNFSLTTVAGTTTCTFNYTISDGHGGTSTVADTVAVGTVAICGDGAVTTPEKCDDANTVSGDGCSATCATVETGFACTPPAGPSVCSPICGDTKVVGNEQCDDGNPNTGDGCTPQCKTEAVGCNLTAHPTATAAVVDPATGHCYLEFGDKVAFSAASTTCTGLGGHLTTIGNAAEEAIVKTSVGTDDPWIGAQDDANTTDAIFKWVDATPFTFTSFAAGEPDNDAGVGGNGDCLHIVGADGTWGDTNCANPTNFVVGESCELEPVVCGDGVVSGTEQCDDGNKLSDDGCSSTCGFELAVWTFTGSAGNEVTYTANLSSPLFASAPAMTRGAGIAPSAGANAFSSSGWTTDTALDATDFYTFTLDPGTHKLSLTGLELDESRSGTGIRTWSVRSSLDAFATDLIVVQVPDVTTFRNDTAIPLDPTTFKNLSAPIEFRIYGYGAEGAAGTWRVDNVEVHGSITN